MKNKGFTLVELAIVLVIIGLLVGGVLQGQELIKQAQIRSVISTIREYDTAVNTFKAKYNGALAGDFNKADSFGICSSCLETTGASAHNGDGDNNLESVTSNAVTGQDIYNGEIANFFIELSSVGLVKGTFVRATATTASTTVDTGMPSLPVGTGLIALSASGQLNYVIGINSGFTAANLNTAANTTTSPFGLTLTPEEAYSFDSKLDNGVATTGAVVAVKQYTSGAFVAADTGSTACVSSTDYRVSISTKVCSIRVRASS